MRVYIEILKSKPSDCTVCPMCNEYDECDLLPKWYKTWDEQYKDCLLKEADE